MSNAVKSDVVQISACRILKLRPIAHSVNAAGRGALDLLLEYADERHVFELKRVPPRHVARERVRAQGMIQIAGYLDTVGVRDGWLLIFDQRAGQTWEDRLTAEDVKVDGKLVRVRGA